MISLRGMRASVFPRNRASLNSATTGIRPRLELKPGPFRGESGQRPPAGNGRRYGPVLKARIPAIDLGRNSPFHLLKWPNSPYRPAVPETTACASHRDPRSGLLGRSQAVRQRILIPPFGGSIPPAPARQSDVLLGFPRDRRIGRKSRLFADSMWSPGSRFANDDLWFRWCWCDAESSGTPPSVVRQFSQKFGPTKFWVPSRL